MSCCHIILDVCNNVLYMHAYILHAFSMATRSQCNCHHHVLTPPGPQTMCAFWFLIKVFAKALVYAALFFMPVDPVLTFPACKTLIVLHIMIGSQYNIRTWYTINTIKNEVIYKRQQHHKKIHQAGPEVHLHFACFLVYGFFNHLVFSNQLVLLNPPFVFFSGLLLQILDIGPGQSMRYLNHMSLPGSSLTSWHGQYSIQYDLGLLETSLLQLQISSIQGEGRRSE